MVVDKDTEKYFRRMRACPSETSHPVGVREHWQRQVCIAFEIWKVRQGLHPRTEWDRLTTSWLFVVGRTTPRKTSGRNNVTNCM